MFINTIIFVTVVIDLPVMQRLILKHIIDKIDISYQKEYGNKENSLLSLVLQERGSKQTLSINMIHNDNQ